MLLVFCTLRNLADLETQRSREGATYMGDTFERRVIGSNMSIKQI